MKRLFYLFLFICISSVYTFAQVKPGSSVTVNAEQVYHFGDAKKLVFKENVIAVSDNYTLTADQADLFITEENTIAKIICTGNVNFKTENILVMSKNADLEQADKSITLSGDVKIWHKDSYIEGQYVKIYYETEEFFIDKGKEDKVTVIFKVDDGEF